MDSMRKVNPEHAKNVIDENGQKLLYIKILQAIYGCIGCALRWYTLYSETLQTEDFVMTPYDRCVANKMIDGKQGTVVWYVNDNKASHKDPKVVTYVMDLMISFRDLTVTKGINIDSLG